MWYTTKVVPDVANVSQQLSVHMSHPGPEHWKALGRLILYINGRETEYTVIIKYKVLKSVMFCDFNYSTDKKTRKSVRGIFVTLGGKSLTCL